MTSVGLPRVPGLPRWVPGSFFTTRHYPGTRTRYPNSKNHLVCPCNICSTKTRTFSFHNRLYFCSSVEFVRNRKMTISLVTNVSWCMVTSHTVILLASRLKRHTSMELFPLNIYLLVLGYLTNYPIGYPGNKLPGYGSPRCRIWLNDASLTLTDRWRRSTFSSYCV